MVDLRLSQNRDCSGTFQNLALQLAGDISSDFHGFVEYMAGQLHLRVDRVLENGFGKISGDGIKSGDDSQVRSQLTGKVSHNFNRLCGAGRTIGCHKDIFKHKHLRSDQHLSCLIYSGGLEASHHQHGASRVMDQLA